MYGSEISASAADARRVEVDRGPSVGRLDALALLDLVEDRLRDRVARPERVGELLAVGVEEHGAVRARRLGDRVALHVRRPGAAVRVVLQRVEVARLGPELDARSASPRRSRRDGSSTARRAPRPRGAAAAGGEDDRRRVELVLAAARPPAVLAGVELGERRLRERRRPSTTRRPRAAHRDRVARPVADLEQALPRRAAAAGEPVAAVLAGELDAELLEPVDRARRLGGEDLDESAVGGLVTRSPDVLGVLLRRVVVADRGLDPPCAFAELQDWSEPLLASATGAAPAQRPRRRRARRRRCRSRARRTGGVRHAGRSYPRLANQSH